MAPSYAGLPGESLTARGCSVAVESTENRAGPLQLILSAQFWLENHEASWGMP